MNLPAKIYTEKEVERAKRSSKVIGWIQGAGVVLGASIVWNMLGWIPTVLVVGAVGYVGYKLLSRSSNKPEE